MLRVGRIHRFRALLCDRLRLGQVISAHLLLRQLLGLVLLIAHVVLVVILRALLRFERAVIARIEPVTNLGNALIVLNCGLVLRLEERLISLLIFVAFEQRVALLLREDLEVFRQQEYVKPLLVLPQHVQLVCSHDRLKNVVDNRVAEWVQNLRLLVGS